MRSFDYRAPTTVAEAVALLSAGGDGARPLAGGTDLLVQVRYGQLQPDLLVDVKRIDEMTRIAWDAAHGLDVGAAVTCAELCEHADVRRAYPGLIDAVSLIGGTAIQGRATLGGNLCNAAPSADSIPALIALGATCAIVGPGGARTVPVERFCTGPGKTVLRAGELLASIHLPPPVPRSGAAYVRFTPRREMDIAVSGAGVWVRLGDDGAIVDARVALSAVAPTPLPVPDAGEDVYIQAARIAQRAAQPIDDVRGTAAQRRHLVGVLVVRALRRAVERAREG